ncbi:MAG: hypothetical protein N4A48_03675 [Tepidibacter sp.]|jgi:hypothetical protein|nr:hypothetical protein [Tepidibacter sp.]MCT4507848.1 hypothetical protein [Tepidibacter sp.]
MLNEKIVQILVDRIKNGGINPRTNKPMQLEDIKIEAYRIEVEKHMID